MATGYITKRAVDAMKPADRDQFLWDDEVRGFGLKVTAGGVRTYVLQYRMGGRGTPTRRYTLGRHGSPWTPEGARKEARRLLEMVRQGTDPQAAAKERQRTETVLAFEPYLERFLTQYGERQWGAGTFASAASNLRRHVLPVLRKKSLPEIKRADITAVLDALPSGKPALPRNVFAHTRKLFSWALERGDIERNPFEGLKSPPAVASRERVLDDGELGLAWRASFELAGAYGPLVRLLTLSGQRREEVAAIDWSELDRRERLWTIPGARTKNGKTQLVPLTDRIVAELDALAGQDGAEASRKWPRAGRVLTSNGKRLSAFSDAKERLDAIMLKLARQDGVEAGEDPELVELKPWRLHDLRRTLSTGMQRLGVRFEVTEAILNHSGASKEGVAGVYQRHDWKEEKRAALEAWGRFVEELLTPSSKSNVVKLERQSA